MNILSLIQEYQDELEAIGSNPPPAPRWNQDWFPRLDAAAAYAMVRTLKPKRIVEVGSGHSTRFLARAVADGRLETRITAIDPEPRASLAGLDIKWIATPVQRVAAFPALGEGDILFQFLSEAVLISVAGGLAGIITGGLLSFGIERFAEIKTLVSYISIAVAFGVSFTVGLVFGIVPAYRAARADPVVSLRYE